MVRALVIQQLYNLSDEQMEFQLLDRLSFQRFVGLRRSSQTPDRSTFWNFGDRLSTAGTSAAVNRQLAKQGYIARGGQIIDPCRVPVLRRRIGHDENELIRQRATPAEWSPAKRR